MADMLENTLESFAQYKAYRAQKYPTATVYLYYMSLYYGLAEFIASSPQASSLFSYQITSSIRISTKY